MSLTAPLNSRNERAKLRHATWIDPHTATRSKRVFSLGLEHTLTNDSVEPNEVPSDQRSGLLNNYAWQDRNKAASDKAKHIAQGMWLFMSSDIGRGMLKCALAYLLGSLATFVPAFSSWFGRQDSKHMVATVTVYFHPARTFGSMLEATMVAGIAFMYTALVSLISMSVSVLFTDVFHLIAVGHAVILIFFVGGGLGYIAWIKVKYGNPLVNIACSLASLSLITVLTKEGAVQAGDWSFIKILQILKMIIIGSLCSLLVCFTVFPQSARRTLRQNMTEVTDELSDMLGLITKSFISGDESELEDAQYVALNRRYMKATAKLPHYFKEAKYEHYFFGDERLVKCEGQLVKCLEQIGQSIGGLRSAAAMQFIVSKRLPTLSQLHRRSTINSVRSAQGPQLDSGSSDPELSEASRVQSFMTVNEWRTPAQIFEVFIANLGPSMRALAYTLKEVLDDVPFDPENDYSVYTNPRFHESLDQALRIYKQARGDALDIVYDKNEMNHSRPIAVDADWEEAAACCGHFSFSLQEVADQVKMLLQSLEELQSTIEVDRTKTWTWLKFWENPWRVIREALRRDEHLDENLKVIRPETRIADGHADFWRNSTHAWWKQRLFQRLYEAFSIMRQEDNKYGIKVGFGALLYALPAFVSATRPAYEHYRGEWGLLSYMLVCSMTIGASNTTGYQRFIGTGLGALIALITWQISNENAVILAFFGFLMAYWTSWIIIGKGKGPMGRFIMLTYNLTALYAYSLSMQDDPNDGDEEDASRNPLIYSIAWHRLVAVLTGCIWGLVITRAVWPISARQKLKDGLSVLWLRMGLIWKRDPLTVFTDDGSPNAYMKMQEELDLHRFLTKLAALVEASKHEFDLRRPFPHDTYDRIIKTTGRMLEAFHAMNVVIAKDLVASEGEKQLLEATKAERQQLCGRLSHQFSILASSVKLEYAIATDALPKTDNARDRLLAKIFAYRKDQAAKPVTKDEDYGLLYTYALVTGQLGIEIEKCLSEIEQLFGILDEEGLLLQ